MQTPASRAFTLVDAGVVTGDGTTTTFTAQPGDTNSVTVTGGGGLPYVITDTGGGDVTPARAARRSRPTSSPAPTRANVVVNLGDGADTFDGSTAAGGNFTINGGNGPDQLTGSNGDDTINGGGDGCDRPDDRRSRQRHDRRWRRDRPRALLELAQ